MDLGDDIKGKANELAGKATDDPDREARGKGQQAGGDVKDAAERLGEAGDEARDAIRDATR